MYITKDSNNKWIYIANTSSSSEKHNIGVFIYDNEGNEHDL